MLVDGASLHTAIRKAAGIIQRSKFRRSKGKPSVWDIPIAFDTETTNYTDGDRDVGWLYIWMLRIGDPLSLMTEFFYGRTVEIWDLFISGICSSLGLDENNLIYVFVHNLGFDLEFIRQTLQIDSELHSNTHEPIFIRDKRGFELRDSKILAGGLSLKKIGDELENGLVKKSGDLDYDLIRTPDTPLTEEEMGYCQGDVDVLASYIYSQIRLYRGINHIPLTNTGRVRRYARDVIYGKVHKGAKARYRELMEECVLTYDEYRQCNRAFAGGYTHANVRYVGKLLKGVVSYDEGSAYPTAMLTERFPMGRPEHIDSCTYDQFRDMVNDPECCILFNIQFKDLKIRDGLGDCYLSNDTNKCVMLNPVSDNGRVRECEKYATTCTDVDFKIIAKCYTWTDIHISNILKWRAEYLPSPIIGIVLDLYNAKTTLKGVPEKKEEYQIKKGMLNSMYGMCVTRILRDVISVGTGEWITTPLTQEEEEENIDKNNNSKTRFLYYPWGVWITAYARFNLWTAILTLGDDYIYSDTDSIKVFADSTKLQDYLDRYHHDLNLKFQWMLEKRKKFTMQDLRPKDIKGRERPMGIWDYEGCYALFKTLGSKRYITYDGETLEPTVAGISPKNLSRYLMDSCDTVEDSIRMFNNGMHVPQGYTGKLASIYYDDVDLDVVDYLGRAYHIRQDHGVHLKPVDFTLTMTGSFLDLIKMLQEVL